MSIKTETPCDYCDCCPYDAQNWSDCEYLCGADEPEDNYYEEDNYNEN